MKDITHSILLVLAYTIAFAHISMRDGSSLVCVGIAGVCVACGLILLKAVDTTKPVRIIHE